MKQIKVILAFTAAGVLLSACTQGATGPPNLHTVNPIANSKLQLAVGTASAGGAVVGLNVVSTMRQPSGESAVLVDTPVLTGPFTLPAAGAAGGGIDAYSTLPGGPSVEEVAAGGTISGTLQSVAPGTPVCDSTSACGGIAPNTSTFGQSGGAFGMGFGPFNYTNSGTASSYVPYPQALYDTGNIPLDNVPWGGPPAFDPDKNGMGVRDGLWNIGSGIRGIGEGITVFENVIPGTGAYSMSVTVPTSVSTTGVVGPAGANLASAAALGHIVAPTVVFNGDGSATFTVAALPAGITEAYLEILDLGNGTSHTCQGPTGTAFDVVYYTIEITAGGAYTLTNNHGPNIGAPGTFSASHSICTAADNAAVPMGSLVGDSIAAYVVGFDYPLFEASYPNSAGNQTPALVGAAAQADVDFGDVLGATSSIHNRTVLENPRVLFHRLAHPRFHR